MARVACPLPTEPKMKFESRTGMTWFASGYTTLGASGPSTSGMGGKGGALRGVIPRSNAGIVGGDTGGGGALATGAVGVGTGLAGERHDARIRKAHAAMDRVVGK